MKENTYFVYILRCIGEKYYIGYTTDPVRRFNEHCGSVKGSKFTRSFMPIEISRCWRVGACRSKAMQIEIFLKKKSKQEKMSYIFHPNKLVQQFPFIDEYEIKKNVDII